MLGLLAIILGLIVGLFLTVKIPAVAFMYLALLVLTTFHSLIYGIKLRTQQRYTNLKLVFYWLCQSLVAFFMNALGDALGLDLATAVVIILGVQIFLDLNYLGHEWAKRWMNRQRTVRVWLQKTGQKPEDLPLEDLTGEMSSRQKQVQDLIAQAKKLRMEADSLLNEADAIYEAEAIQKLGEMTEKSEEEDKS